MNYINTIDHPNDFEREEILEVESQLIEICVLCSDPKIFNTANMTIFALNVYESIPKEERMAFLKEFTDDMMNAFEVLDKQDRKNACF